MVNRDITYDIEDLRTFPNGKYALILGSDLESRHSKNIAAALETFSALNFNMTEVITDEGCFVNQSRQNSGSSSTFKLADSYSLSYAVERLGARTDAKDLLFIYTTGHGDEFLGEVALFTNNRFTTASRFALEVGRKMPTNPIMVVADHCFGYDFMRQFITRENTRGVSASAEGELSTAETFPSEFWPALRDTGNISKAFDTAFEYDKNRKLGAQCPQFAEFAAGAIKVRPEVEASHSRSRRADVDQLIEAIARSICLEEDPEIQMEMLRHLVTKDHDPLTAQLGREFPYFQRDN